MCGSRRPNRFRFGPCNTRMNTMTSPTAPTVLRLPARSVATTLFRRAHGWNRGNDLLLAASHLDDKTFAVEIAVSIERDVEKNTGIVLRRNLRAVQPRGKRFRVELADLLGHRLDDVNGRITLDAVVVGAIAVLLLELVVERLDRGLRRVGG